MGIIHLVLLLFYNLGFWTAAIDLMATQYPGRRATLRGASLRAMQLRVDLLRVLLERAFRGEAWAENIVITYRGHDLGRVTAELTLVEDAQSATVRSWVRAVTIEGSGRPLFSQVSAGAPLGGFEPMASTMRGDDVTGGNMAYEMRLFRAFTEQQFLGLLTGFERGLLYVRERPRHGRAEGVFERAMNLIDHDLDTLKDELLQVEYQWLRAKYREARFSPQYRDETQVDGYADIRDRYDGIRGRIMEKLGHMRQMNFVMMGVQPTDLTNIDVVSAQVATLIDHEAQSDVIGANLCVRLLSPATTPLRRWATTLWRRWFPPSLFR